MGSGGGWEAEWFSGSYVLLRHYDVTGAEISCYGNTLVATQYQQLPLIISIIFNTKF